MKKYFVELQKLVLIFAPLLLLAFAVFKLYYLLVTKGLNNIFPSNEDPGFFVLILIFCGFLLVAIGSWLFIYRFVLMIELKLKFIGIEDIKKYLGKRNLLDLKLKRGSTQNINNST